MKTLASINFGFLQKREPLLARYGALAERFVFEDPDTALIKIRQLIEGIANLTATYTGIPNYEGTTLAELISTFRSEGVIAQDLADLWHTIRKDANAAAHNEKQFTQSEALTALKYSRSLAVWFHRSFGRDPSFKPGPFVPPQAPKDATADLTMELEAVRREMHEKLAELEAAKLIAKDYEEKALKAYADNEALLSLAEETESRATRDREEKEALNQRLSELKNATDEKTDEEIVTLIHQAEKASRELDLSEADTRKIIDKQLRDAGWDADTQRLDYRKGARPQKGKFLAIAEWPTKSGPADYVLFDGLLPLAVVEAKRRNRNVSSYIGTQATRYSQGFLGEGAAHSHESDWGGFRVPFLFSANGRPYLEQIREESGIWFRDARRPVNLSRPLSSWYSPEGLKHLLKQDEDRAQAALKAESLDYLPLHFYQREAVLKVEDAIASGRRTALVAMATGTGKTRVCVCLIYRLLKAKKFRRVLFLVDRTALGDQALDENFKHIKLEGGRSFADIYEVKELKDIRPETDTKLHVATVQGMMKRVLYPSDDVPPPSVDTYDLIVIDECHRGYTLDKDLSDNELNFRSEEEYLSKYRRVVEYFDAVKVGVTATPAPHTKQIFGAPVHVYSYREAVIDDILVDHLPPYRILTQLGEDGITWQVGERIEVYQPRTGEIDLFDTPDEINLEIEDFNRSVITESFNRAVCSALAAEIDPLSPGKTLIYCVDDLHADMVVRLLKETFQEVYGEIQDNSVVKITGEPKTDRPKELLKKYKNDQFPSVAVTVDYLTTGVDVPAIVNLVFIRRVRSRILYEQMLGRATRKRPDLFGSGQDKDAFKIFDAVDLYSAIQEWNTMRPVVAQPKISFETLLGELDHVGTAEERQEVYEQLVAKLNRRLKRISPERAGELEAVTGVSVKDLAAHVRTLGPQATKDYFKDKGARVASILDSREESDGKPRLVSHHPDVFIGIERGYGDFDRPEDYLTAFKSYLDENRNKISALMVVTTRPSKLTRKDLRELKFILDRAGFPEKSLDSAYQETAHQTAASIIGYIRCAALGSPLVPYEQRVARAMQKIYTSRAWNGAQLGWLKRFEKQLRLEVILDGEALNGGQFQTEGGFARINKIFAGQAEQVLSEIHDEIWKDVA